MYFFWTAFLFLGLLGGGPLLILGSATTDDTIKTASQRSPSISKSDCPKGASKYGKDKRDMYVHGTSCFEFVADYSNDGSTQAEARQKCENNGGHLVSIESQNVTDFILTILNKYYREGKLGQLPTSFWIGLDKRNSNEYRWEDGSGLTFKNWGDEKGSQTFMQRFQALGWAYYRTITWGFRQHPTKEPYCVVLAYPSGHWYEMDCSNIFFQSGSHMSNRQRFICRYEPKISQDKTTS